MGKNAGMEGEGQGGFFRLGKTCIVSPPSLSRSLLINSLLLEKWNVPPSDYLEVSLQGHFKCLLVTFGRDLVRTQNFKFLA